MGLEEIIGKIDQEASDQAAKIASDAREAASKTVGDAKARAEAIISQARAQAEREAKEERVRSVASARLAAKRELLLAREDVLRRYEQDVLGSVDDFTKSDGYSTFLMKAIDDGVEKIGKDAVVQVNSRDRSLLKGKKLAAEISKDAIECQGGALITAADGRRRVDNTVESLLRDRRDTIRLKLVAQLFGDEPKAGA